MAGRKGIPTIDRFFEKVQKSDDCWEWLAKKNNKGYGMFGGAKAAGFSLAHRVSFEIANGPIPEGKWVLHRCDNPGCVNPKHLFLGTRSDNSNDMHRKGRGWGGIGPEIAYEILWRRVSGEPRRRLVAEYGVGLDVVKHITQRDTWQILSQAHD